MKNILNLILLFIFFVLIINVQSANIISVKIRPEIGLRYEYTDDGYIKLFWSKYIPEGFNSYKILKSAYDPNLLYPYYNPFRSIEDSSTLAFIDNDINFDNVYYRLCVDSEDNIFCSKTIYVDKNLGSNNKWVIKCTEWNGKVDTENKICNFDNDIWCNDQDFKDGECENLFKKYGDPRKNIESKKDVISEDIIYKSWQDVCAELGGYIDKNRCRWYNGLWCDDEYIEKKDECKKVILRYGTSKQKELANSVFDTKIISNDIKSQVNIKKENNDWKESCKTLLGSVINNRCEWQGIMWCDDKDFQNESCYEIIAKYGKQTHKAILNKLKTEQKEQTQCTEWHGTIKDNLCKFKNGVWCYRNALLNGQCESVFKKYGDPRH